MIQTTVKEAKRLQALDPTRIPDSVRAACSKELVHDKEPQLGKLLAEALLIHKRVSVRNGRLCDSTHGFRLSKSEIAVSLNRYVSLVHTYPYGVYPKTLTGEAVDKAIAALLTVAPAYVEKTPVDGVQLLLTFIASEFAECKLFTAGDLARLRENSDNGLLVKALYSLMSGRSSTVGIGRMLQKHKDSVREGKALRFAGVNRGKAALWQWVTVTEDTK